VGAVLVEVWSDVVCPWCYIGKRRFAAATAILEADAEFDDPIDVVYRAFQLDPRAPRDTTVPVVDAYARKFGGPAEAARIIDHMTALAAAEGLEFHLDRAQRANTLDAHRLLWLAGAEGPSGSQADAKERLLAAYFTEGRNVADPAELVDIGAAAGLDPAAVAAMLAGDRGRAEVEADLRAARERDIGGVPAYVIDGRWTIPGAQDPDVFVQVLRRLAATRRAG